MKYSNSNGLSMQPNPQINYMKYTLLLTAILLSIITNAQNLEWAKSITGPGTGSGRSMTIDHSGNIILTSSFLNKLDLDPGTGEFIVEPPGEKVNSFIAKYTNSGSLLWGGVFTNKDGYVEGTQTCADSDNNVFVTGVFQYEADLDPTAGEYMVQGIGGARTPFIVKLDSTGKFLWAKTLSKTVNLMSITSDATGNIFTTGYFTDTVDFDPGADTTRYISVGTYDGFIAKYDNNGEFIWVHALITSEEGSATFGVLCNELEIKSTGELVVAGVFDGTVVFDEYEEGISLTSKAQGRDAYFLELNVDGKLNWVKQIESEIFINLVRLNVFSNDSILVSGKFVGLTDFDPSSNKFEWYDFGGGDVFFAKYTPNGDFVQVDALGGQQFEGLGETVIDDNGHIYLTGAFGGPCSFTSSGNLDTSLTPKGYSDVYLAQYNTKGQLICARSFGYEYDISDSYDLDNEPRGLGLAKNGNVIYYGMFKNTFDIDPNEGETILTSLGPKNLVFAEFSPCSNGVGASSIAPTLRKSFIIKAYPNPTNGIIQFDFKNDDNPVISIKDMHGRNIDFVRTANNTIDISSAVNGIYFASIQINNVVQSFRIIKQ